MADTVDATKETSPSEETAKPTDARSKAEKLGDEERSAQQSEIRDAVAEGLSSLGGFGAHASGVTIVPGGASTFSGPIAGRDIIIGGNRDDALQREVSAETVAEIRRNHVPPVGYDELADALRQDAVVLVRAPERWGTTTTAIHLLGRVGAVRRLAFSGHLSRLPVDNLPKDCGFLLSRVGRGQVTDLGDHDVRALQDSLAKRRSRLIATFDNNVRLRDPTLDGRVVTVAAPPPAVEVVISHMTDRLSRSRAEKFVADHDLAGRLKAIDTGSYDISQLVAFARDLADAAEDRCSVEDAVSRFDDRSRQDLETWLDGIADHDQKATVVSLAVLNRMPYDAVARSAAPLEREWRLEDAGGGHAAPRARRTKSARVQNARARLTHEVRQTRYGPAELEIAAFVDDSYPRRVLHHLWHEHDYDRDLIAAWLKQVAQDVEGRVRIRAAQAIGFLAQYAFDTIRRDVIVPWAGSGNGDERERAVAALSLPAQNPDTFGRTARLVLDWSERKGDALRLSAARALGRSVGAMLPNGPDERLTELAKAVDPDLAIAIGDSIGELLIDGDHARRLALLTLLDDWSGQTKVLRQTAGVWGFLEVAQGLTTTEPTADGVVRWPTVLRFADEDAAMREVIARLFGKVLRAPDAYYGVHAVLRNWARRAEREPRLRQAMVSLLVDVAGMSPRLADLVAAQARTWRQTEPVAPDLAIRLLEALSGSGIR